MQIKIKVKCVENGAVCLMLVLVYMLCLSTLDFTINLCMISVGKKLKMVSLIAVLY